MTRELKEMAYDLFDAYERGTSVFRGGRGMLTCSSDAISIDMSRSTRLTHASLGADRPDVEEKKEYNRSISRKED
jgi:hypothetical protein